MVLADTREYEAMVAELKRQQSAQREKFTIEIFHGPVRKREKAPIRSAWWWLLMTGMLLALHGAPLIMISYPFRGPAPQVHREPPRAALGIFKAVARRFRTWEEFQHAARYTGWILMASSFVCLALAVFLMSREKPEPVVGDERILPPPANPADTV